jgi:hypothetical protein
MFERAIVPIVLFVLAFAGLLTYRWYSRGKIEFQLWDAFIAVVPSLIWMIGSGYFLAVELGPNGFKIQRAAEALVQANDTLVRTVYQPLKAVDFSDIAAMVEPYAEDEEDAMSSPLGDAEALTAAPLAAAADPAVESPVAEMLPGGSPESPATLPAEPEFEQIEPQGDASNENDTQVVNMLRGFGVAVFRPAHERFSAAVIGAFFEARYNDDLEIPVEYVAFTRPDNKLTMFCKAASLAFSRRYYAGTTGVAGRYYELLRQKIGHPDELISLLGGDAGGRHIHDSCYLQSQTVTLDQNISAAVSTMDILDRSYLPVVDSAGTLVGIVVQNDLVNHVVLQVLKASESAR